MRKIRKSISILLVFAMLVSMLSGLTLTAGAEEGEESSGSVSTVTLESGPTQTAYVVGQSFDPTGIVVTAVSEDGTSETLTDWTVDRTEAFTDTDVGEVTIHITGAYNGEDYDLTTVVTVEVFAPRVIYVTTQPKLAYYEGEALDLSAMQVTAYYNDVPSTKVVLSPEEYTTSPADGTILTVEDNGTPVTVSYTDNGVTVTQDSSALVVLSNADKPAQDANDVYLIGTADELSWFASRVNTYHDNTANARLTADIVANEGFYGIGIQTYPYQGTFDGDGHTLTVEIAPDGSPSSMITGRALFNYLNGTVKNLTLAGSVKNTSVDGSHLAGIAAYMKGGTIENCVNNATVENTYTLSPPSVGGIVCETTGTCRVINCVNNGTITNTGFYGYVGGIVGSGGSDTTIEGCANHGAVTGKYYVGGILGYGASPNILNCYNTGDVTNDRSTTLTYCYAGGILGRGVASIENCYNAGMIKATSNTYLGSISGSSASSATCFNNYALVNTAASNLTDPSGVSGTFVSSEELTELAGTLGEAYKENPNEDFINGYPVLAWEEIPPLAVKPTFTVSSGTMASDGTVTLNVSIDSLEELGLTIGGFALQLVWDDALEITDIDMSGGLCPEGTYTANAETGVVSYAGTDGISTSGTLFTVKLKADEVTAIRTGEYKVKLTVPADGSITSVNDASTDLSGGCRFVKGVVSVNASDLDGNWTKVELFSGPTTDVYVEGQTFNTAGIVVSASFSDGTTEVVTGWTVDRTEPFTAEDVGLVTVHIIGTVNGVSFDFSTDVIVDDRQLLSVAVTTQPNLNYLEGDALDLSAMVVSGYFNDAPDTAVPLSAEEYTADPADGTILDPAVHNGSTIKLTYTYRGETMTAESEALTVMANAFQPEQDENGVFLIGTADELDWFAFYVNVFNTSASARLTADITANDGFTRFETYKGVFDGDGHALTVYNIDGLFGNLYGTVKNLTLNGAMSGTTGFVYSMESDSVVENCVNNASLATAMNGSYAGGIAGYAYKCTIRNCVNNADMNIETASVTSYYIGGVVGDVSGSATVEGCVNNGSIKTGTDLTSASGFLGGVAGRVAANTSISFTRCVNNGSVEGSVITGGVVGTVPSLSTTTITTIADCANHGQVTGHGLYVGGVLGYSGYTGHKLTNCYNTGDVTCTEITQKTSTRMVGGITGNPATVTNAYNSGTITGSVTSGSVSCGGISGSSTNGSYTNNYTLENSVPTLGVLGKNGTVVTADELKALAETLGESFKENTNPYYMDGYPVLAWEEIPPVQPVITMESGWMAFDGAVTLKVGLGHMEHYDAAIGAFTLQLACDDALEITAIDMSGGLCPEGTYTANAETGVVTYTGSDGISTSGTLMTVTLKAADAAAITGGDYSVSVAVPSGGAITSAAETPADLTGDVDFSLASGVVTVYELSDVVTDVTLVSGPSTTAYKEGETFDPSGIVVSATFRDGSSKTLTDWTVDRTESFAYEDAGEVTIHITGTVNSVEYDCTTTVTVTALAARDENGVILIGTADELDFFSSWAKTNPSANARLTADITASDAFTPIGSSAYYTGTFDGDGHTVTLNLSGSSCVALIANLSTGGVVKNLTVAGTVTGSSYYVAGVVSYLRGGAVENCVNKANVTGSYNVGGIVGYISGSAGTTVTNCANEGAISATYTSASTSYGVGGIVGYQYPAGTVEGCVNTGSVTTTGPYAGGVVGITYNAESVVKNCYNTGSVTNIGTAKAYMGGIVGYTRNASATLQNCYSTGRVAGTGYPYGVGYMYSATMANVSNVYCLQGTPTNRTGIGAVKTADAMKAADFVALLNGEDGTAWKAGNIVTNDGYPILSWQTLNEVPVLPTITVSDGTMASDGTVTLNVNISNVNTSGLGELTIGSFTLKLVSDDALTITAIDMSGGVCANGLCTSDPATGTINYASTTGFNEDGLLLTVTLKAADITAIESGTYSVSVTVPANGTITTTADASADLSGKFLYESGTVTVDASILTPPTVNVNVNNKTGETPAATVTAPAAGWINGENTFTVSSEAACVVALKNSDGTYTSLTAAANDDGSYSFTATLAEDSEIVVAVKGDADGDGEVRALDALKMLDVSSEAEVATDLEKLVIDLDGDGKVSALEALQVLDVSSGAATLDW